MKRKERVILTAIDIISDLGFQGLTTKEICRRQEISDGTLYKHFRSKDEIILGVLDYYSKFDKSIKDTTELNKFSAKESIIFFFKMISEYYENYPSISAISNNYETLQHEANISEKAKEIFQSRSRLIIRYIEKAKENGELRSDIDSEGFADIILGGVRETILKWRMYNFNFSLKEKVISNIDMLLKMC
ncbi:TetR/AcrR family transcriptional regulator [Clostridium magnum]|nr:TetR/AcrR family transcriptional regulator [Clostridium magnum]